MALLYRTGLPIASFPRTMLGVVAAAGIGVIAIVLSADSTTAGGAYFAFSGALAIWALHETSYLLGYVTGPRARACPESATGFARFWYGLKASLYHEIAIVLTAAVLAAALWNSANRVALATFPALWLMRWSTKLNIFLGVRNLHREFWPTHLDYLGSYARERSMNVLFPWSIAAALLAIVIILQRSTSAQTDAARIGAVLVVTLLVLAIFEHVLLMLRVPDESLWRVGMRSRRHVS